MATAVQKKEKPKKGRIKPQITQKYDHVEPLLVNNDETEIVASTSRGVAITVEEQRQIYEIGNLGEVKAIATLTNKKVVSNECDVSHDYKEPNEEKPNDQNGREKQTDKQSYNLISLKEGLKEVESMIDQVNKATAPPCNIDNAAISKATIVQYPNLVPIQQIEKISEVVYTETRRKSAGFSLYRTNLEPFTAEQLKNIYDCPELELIKQFELEFLMNALLDTYKNDPLYMAMHEYYTLQSKLSTNLHNIKLDRKNLEKLQNTLWKEENETKRYSGNCGDDNVVWTSVTYNITKIDPTKLESIKVAMSLFFDIVCYTYNTNLINARMFKIKIDQMINELLVYCSAENAYVSLHNKLDVKNLQIVANLRHAISILFSFARKLSPNSQFKKDLRNWLRQLISLHLLLATKEDHWFLLFNILRCPNGVGNWATEFLQIPLNNVVYSVTTSNAFKPSESPLPLNSPEMNHCIAVLQVLLLPIKKRNEFLKPFVESQTEITNVRSEERWILIDSDGEDSHTSAGECMGLKESDLIAFVNQIPFEKMFTSVLSIERFLDDYIIESDKVTTQHMLNAIVFFNKLVEIIGEGLITYNTERYKQLAKRLGRLLRHILQYVFDYHELFIYNNLAKDGKMLERIELELNVLLNKSCGYIYRTRNLATWQYFSSLPYYTLNADAIWQIFYYLNVGFPSELPTTFEDPIELFNTPDFWNKFNLSVADVAAEDLYYLLQTFFEMASERDKVKDWQLIKEICLHIFNIGFINPQTRDICYKTSRDMLVNITLAYVDLISCLLLQLKIRFGETENAVYLFKSLPLENWKPSIDSFEILSNWLLHYDLQSPENMLARLIISHLNWAFDCDKHLFLPHDIHVRMACLISEALKTHAPKVIGVSNITENVRHVSSLIDVAQSAREQFTNWCWSMVSILRLHIMDQSVEIIKRTLQNPTESLMIVPELERIDVIYQSVTDNQSLSIFVALLVSLHGHSVPLVCQKGFEFMKLLLDDYQHAAVIRCIELIMPLFMETPETLAYCDGFRIILNRLLKADSTYLKMAKDMVYSNAIGPVLELLNNMMHHQITSYSNYGLYSPLNMINIWLTCLTALPNWQQTNVLYLLDKILSLTYPFSDCRIQAIEYFHKYYKDYENWKGVNKSTLQAIFGTVPVSRVPAITPDQCWLALFLLDIEFQMYDIKFWNEFLRQLATSQLEAALKKTLGIIKINFFAPSLLVIYKYANLIANMNITHPLFPILNQKFFELYLWRLPIDDNEHGLQTVFGVSDKFFEYNIPLMKKIKAKLNAAKLHYDNESKAHASCEDLSHFYRNCSKLMKTFELWLEETSINKIPKDEFDLPVQYNKKKLNEILLGNTFHWTEYIYPRIIHDQQLKLSEKWARKCFRLRAISKPLLSPPQSKFKRTPIERIKNLLTSYDKCIDAPVYSPPDIYVNNQIDSNTLNLLKQKIQMLNRTANQFHFQTTELNSLNCNYLENWVLKLYENVSFNDTKVVPCTSLLFNRTCKSPAHIKVTMKHVSINNAIDRKIKNYVERHNQIINEMIEMNVDNFVQTIQELSLIMRNILEAQMTSTENTWVKKTGLDFFYYIIENITEITMKFTPTRDLYTQILDQLAVFIQNHQEEEGLRILQLALQRPDLIKVFSGVFVPSCTEPKCFLKMYKFLIDSYLKYCDTKILFNLLSKFDLGNWLNAFQPKPSDITQLLNLVLQGLESWSQPDSSLLQDQFRCHLVQIYDYDFPKNFSAVLQAVLDRISDKKLMPVILLDLLNSLLKRTQLEPICLDISNVQIVEMSQNFARRQKLFHLKAATDILTLFARHFQKERLHHGLHGLYPTHEIFCKPLAIWFSCCSYVMVSEAISTYQKILVDQICDVVFGSIIEMYSPWLITYTEQSILHSSANWIYQLTQNGKMLSPWSEKYAVNSEIMIRSFINTLKYILGILPGSDKILVHTFSWYIHHFTMETMEKHVLQPMHQGIADLPWEQFKPHTQHLDYIYENLHKCIPEIHHMLGSIFIRIDWPAWFTDTLPLIQFSAQNHTISRLFTIFIRIAFEPNMHKHINMSKILEEAINYPWHRVDYTELEALMKYFVASVEPLIVLQLPGECNYTDRAVLELLRLSCALTPERITNEPIFNATAKRMLYTRSIIRLHRACASKHQKLLATKEGRNAFNVSFVALLDAIDNAINISTSNYTLEEKKREALNLMIEIVAPMQTQSEETSNLHIEALMQWQRQKDPANILMCSTLHAIGHMNNFIGGIYTLLEASIESYFRTSEMTREYHTPSWGGLLCALQMSLAKLELMPIMNGSYFLTLHIYVLYKLEEIENLGDKITFLQDLTQLAESFKTSPETEVRLSLIWGLIISRGCKILSESEHVKKTLLMLARHLQIASTQAEGWSDGLLGAIGLKKDIVTNKRKILTRCLAIVVFSLFPHNYAGTMQPCEEFSSSMRELSVLLSNKKFSEVKHLITKVITILNDNKMPVQRDVPHLIYRLIGVFYELEYLMTIPEVWDFDFKLK